MANGGSWTLADVDDPGTRPGFYINFIQVAQALVTSGTRGIVGVLTEGDWGPPNAVQVFTELAQADNIFSAREVAAHRIYNLTRLAFLGGAQSVKAIRVMNTTNALKATLAIENQTDATVIFNINAKYEGTFGNTLAVIIGDDPGDATKTRVQITLSGVIVHTVTSTINHGTAGFAQDLVDLLNALSSIYIDAVFVAAGDNDAADLTETNLATGANGDAVTVTEYDAALVLFQTTEVHLVSSDITTAGILTSAATWAADRRVEGQRLQLVVGSELADVAATIVADAQGFNDEAVIFVGPGAIMPNVAGVGTTYNGATIASMVAGIVAGLATDRSPTFAGLPTATGVELTFTNAQYKNLIAGGALAISPTPFGANPGARIERGITTLYNPSGSDIADFKQLRIVRIADNIANGLSVSAAENFIGAELNDVEGRQIIIDAVSNFLTTQVEARTILPTFTVEIDTGKDNSGTNLFLLIGITPIDAIEMVFTEITIS